MKWSLHEERVLWHSGTSYIEERSVFHHLMIVSTKPSGLSGRQRKLKYRAPERFGAQSAKWPSSLLQPKMKVVRVGYEGSISPAMAQRGNKINCTLPLLLLWRGIIRTNHSQPYYAKEGFESNNQPFHSIVPPGSF